MLLSKITVNIFRQSKQNFIVQKFQINRKLSNIKESHKIRKEMKQNNDHRKPELKKHKRVKSQQMIYSSQYAGTSQFKDHADTTKNRKHGYTVLYLNQGDHSQHRISKQFHKNHEEHSSVKHQTKIIVNPDTSMQKIKQIIYQKLGLSSSQGSSLFLMSAEPEDINFDYRLDEEIGNIGQQDRKLNYFFVNSDVKVNQNEDLQGVNKIKEGKQISDYFVYDCLSVGGFSKVFLVRSKKSGKFYAAKFIDKSYDKSPKFQDLIYNQRYINELLDYKLLVKMHSFIETKQFFIFILDYCPSGELFCLMKSHRDMTEAEAKFYFIETILAIDYMHSKSIIYRDIKPENILLDKNGHIKIADFGLAKIMREKSTSYCGSLEYMAPEIVLGNQHSFGVDHYCLGSLLFEMMVGCPPFYNPNFTSTQTKYHIVNSDVKFPSGRNYSHELIDFVNKLLDKNPKTRLGSLGGIKQILAHPWIGKFDRQKYEKQLIEPPFRLSLDKSNFQTTYLPVDAIEEMKNRISLEIEQKDINAGFRKRSQKVDLIESKTRKRLRSTQNIKYSATTTPSKMTGYMNPYQMQLTKYHGNKTNKKLSFSALKYTTPKNDSQSLHYESTSKLNKNRSLTRNSKSQKFQNSNVPGIKNILAMKVSKQNGLKNSFNDMNRSTKNLHRKSINMDKDTNMKSKFQTKAKQAREANKFLKAYLKSTNKQKQNKIANRISKALLSPCKD